jgi:YfiH family protein
VTRQSLTWGESETVRWLEWRCGDAAAAFPTREGGVSREPWHSLNLGLKVGDDPAAVRENRRRLCVAIGVSPERLVVPDQVHGTTVRDVDAAECGMGAWEATTAIAACDGLITSVPDVGLAVSTADCLPIVIVASGDDGPILAAVHAGWRGVLAGIAREAAAVLSTRGRLLAAVIGPGIGPCCFVVDEALRTRFAVRFTGVVQGDGVDLAAAATADLHAAGVPARAVTRSGICTSCDARFYSHRRDGGLTGRHLAIAWHHGGTPSAADGGG